MIIKDDYLERKPNYLEEERKGFDKLISIFDKRFKNNEIERDNFLKGLKNFESKKEELNKKIKKFK